MILPRLKFETRPQKRQQYGLQKTGFIHLLCPRWCWLLRGIFGAILTHLISQDLQQSNRGFPIPQSSLRRVAGFFCNGEIGAPGLTKPSDDLAQREQVRATKMDGWVWLGFSGDEKNSETEKLRWMFAWRRELHVIFILHMYLYLCFYLQIYARWWFRIQPRCWMVLHLQKRVSCRVGWILPGWKWLHDEVRPMSLHGFTAVFALLGDGSLCVCFCHGKM